MRAYYEAKEKFSGVTVMRIARNGDEVHSRSNCCT